MEEDVARKKVLEECLTFMHKRLFKEKCTRQDVIQRKVRNKETCCSVIKTTWNAFCKPEGRLLDIGDILFHLNKAIAEAYVLANLHVLRLCQEGRPIPEINQTFYYQCLSAVSTGERARSEIKDLQFRQTVQLYRSSRPEGTDFARGSHMGSGWFQQASQQMATAAKNSTSMNFYRRFKRYLKSKYTLQGTQAYLALKHIQSPTYEGVDPLVLRYRALLPPKPKYGLREDSPELVTPMQFMFLKHFETAGMRLFSLLPMKRGFECSHAKMCTNGLQSLLKRNNINSIVNENDQPVPLPKTTAPFRDLADDVWRYHFNIAKYETANRKFAGEILTDGKAVSIVMRRPKVECQPQPAKDVDEYGEIWGLDPGRREIYVASNQNKNVKRCSTRQYYHDAGFKRSNKKTAYWEEHDPEVKEACAQMPSPKSSQVADLQAYVTFMVGRLDMLLAFQMRKGYRHCKFRRHTLKQKRLRQMCADITEVAGRNTLVGFGDWSAKDDAGIIKKCPAGPVKALERELKRYCKVVSVDEFRTSKMHELCHCELNKTSRRKACRDGVTRRVKNYSVLYCSNSSCRGMTVNRDVNASRNILACLLCEVRETARPPAFCRGQFPWAPAVFPEQLAAATVETPSLDSCKGLEKPCCSIITEIGNLPPDSGV